MSAEVEAAARAAQQAQLRLRMFPVFDAVEAWIVCAVKVGLGAPDTGAAGDLLKAREHLADMIIEAINDD